MDIYKVEIKASDYPNTPSRAKLLSSGDTIFVKDGKHVNVGVGIVIITSRFIRCFIKNGGTSGRRKNK